ncbi:ABC transporter substrate-binding protein [Gordonia liuliyuniae]|uniref:ABC transporter substrate-binding protein n=1 Tax=Gordonia liuliyuniae TaxID=2911517 RepID=A0ABS9ITV7_9ACTN|nr:ABC transporter substrate-binding protein [Gordonia liuliyuniae]MCF8588956.1 ABC transporter substrate-binding protein [Gordonia liuliyuniae]
MRARLMTMSGVALLLAASLAACGGGDDATGDSADGSSTAKVSVTPGTIWGIPIAVAEKNGYFKDAAIDVTVQASPSGMGHNQLLASGVEDFGPSSPSQALAAIQQGQDATISCGGNHRTPTAIVAPAGSTLPSAAKGATSLDVLRSLKGKTLGMPAAAGTGTANLMAQTLASVGLKEGDYTLVNIGSGTTAQAALVSKQVDAAMAATPTGETVVGDGTAVQLAELSDDVPNYQLIGGVWQSRASWVKDNPKATEAFCAAMGKAYEYLQNPANAKSVDQFVLDGVGAKTAPSAVTAIRENFSVMTADVPEAEMTKTIDVLTSIGVLKPQPAVTYAQAVTAQS